MDSCAARPQHTGEADISRTHTEIFFRRSRIPGGGAPKQRREDGAFVFLEYWFWDREDARGCGTQPVLIWSAPAAWAGDAWAHSFTLSVGCRDAETQAKMARQFASGGTRRSQCRWFEWQRF